MSQDNRDDSASESESVSIDIKPRLSLTVGVTGHRAHRLAGVNLAALAAVVATTLQQLQTAMDAVKRDHQSAFADKPAQLRMVSALADGADTMVANAALAAGWRVDGCLPFSREVYANDFSGTAYDEFIELLRNMTATFELPGKHSEAAERDSAYEAVGRLVLEQSDIVLAIWDGDLGRGRGGTSRVVADAVARHIPVIHIHTRSAEAPLLLWSGLSDAEIEQPSVELVPRVAAETGIASAVGLLCVPPEHKVDQRMLTQFFHKVNRERKRTPAMPYPMLLAVTGVRALSRRDWQAPQAAASAAQLEQLLSTSSNRQQSASALLLRYGTADAAASYFAQIFRSGFVTNFSLAALAVMLALSGPLFPALKLPLISAELLIVMVILMTTRAGTKSGWHERWMDNRHLAEQLRSLALGRLIGDLGLRAHGGGEASAVPGWVGWLTRASAREVGLPHAVADQAYLERVRNTAIALIDDQLAYHHHNAHRMHTLDHRLHRAGGILFGGTIVACAAWIIGKLAGVQMSAPGVIGPTEIVTALTAAMPALGAALYGIRMQGDFSGVEFRARATVTRLQGLKRAMLADPHEYTHLSVRLRNLADIMRSDVANWRTTYQARPLALPG